MIFIPEGKTSQKEWRSCIQESLAPWGELATDNIILTVPTENLRTLEDPEPVLRLWDKMMQAIARLAAQPFPFHRPERIVADVQISAGRCHRERFLASGPFIILPFLNVQYGKGIILLIKVKSHKRVDLDGTQRCYT